MRFEFAKHRHYSATDQSTAKCGKATTEIRDRGTDRVPAISESLSGWKRRSHNWSDRVHSTVRIKLDIRSDRMGPAISGCGMTDEGFSSPKDGVIVMGKIMLTISRSRMDRDQLGDRDQGADRYRD